MTMVAVAIVGVGKFGQEHLNAFRQIPGVQVVGIVEPDSVRAQTIANAYSVEAYPDVKSLMSAESPDAVSIAAPTHLHENLLSALSGYDCRILVEKPLTTGADAAKRMSAGLDPDRVMVGHILRFAQPYEMLREDVQQSSGIRGGSSKRVRPSDHLSDFPRDDIVSLTMIHDLDAIAWITTERIERVRATGRATSEGRWFQVDSELMLSGGGSWHCSALWGGDHDDSMSAAGSSLHITDSATTFTTSQGSVRSMAGAESVYGQALLAELTHFINRVSDPSLESAFSLDDAAHAVCVAEAIGRSLDEGGEVDVSQ